MKPIISQRLLRTISSFHVGVAMITTDIYTVTFLRGPSANNIAMLTSSVNFTSSLSPESKTPCSGETEHHLPVSSTAAGVGLALPPPTLAEEKVPPPPSGCSFSPSSGWVSLPTLLSSCFPPPFAAPPPPPSPDSFAEQDDARPNRSSLPLSSSVSDSLRSSFASGLCSLSLPCGDLGRSGFELFGAGCWEEWTLKVAGTLSSVGNGRTRKGSAK